MGNSMENVVRGITGRFYKIFCLEHEVMDFGEYSHIVLLMAILHRASLLVNILRKWHDE